MCWIIRDLNPVSENSQIAFPNLQTARRIHTASYVVSTGGSAVQDKTRKTATHVVCKNATLCYKENCHTMLYVKLPKCVILTSSNM
jgi:fibrillarin-like rRNA methylase